MTKQWAVEELFAISGAYWAGCALQAAVQLDVFTALAQGPRKEEELADALGCNRRSFSMLLTALSSMELVEREGDRISAVPSALPFLSASSPDYAGFIFKHHAHIMPGWAQLAAAVKAGGRPGAVPAAHAGDDAEREAFLMGMFNVARLQAETVAGALDLSRRSRLLDVGGGPGTYAVYFCRANPALAATIFDLPATEPFARKIVRQYGMEGRVDFAGGHFLNDPLPSGHDVAWLSQVLHGETPENAAALVKRSAAALEPGGIICIQEFMLNDDQRGPRYAALFSLNMLVQTKGGQAYSQGDITAMLMAAGATGVRSLDVALPRDCRVLVGQMP